jgi:hypothetical protein
MCFKIIYSPAFYFTSNYNSLTFVFDPAFPRRFTNYPLKSPLKFHKSTAYLVCNFRPCHIAHHLASFFSRITYYEYEGLKSYLYYPDAKLAKKFQS